MSRPIHLSASAIREFLHCPNCFRYAYVEGIRPLEDTESQRVGTNWHKLHEIYRYHANLPEHENGGWSPFDTAIAHLNEVYAKVPNTKTAEEWETERTILASSFAAYVWYYQNDEVETVATEVGFKLPLRHPGTGLPLPTTEVLVPGKIDRIIRQEGRISVSDYKSTTKSLDPDSDFWGHLRLDPQLSTYVMALHDLREMGLLDQHGILPGEEIQGAYYDVWHKPQIGAKFVSQGDTEKMFGTGEYYGQQFAFAVARGDEGVVQGVHVDGQFTTFEVGTTKGEPNKKVSIRETPAMFGARLLADIMARPSYYFVRKEVSRTDDDVRKFRHEVWSLYQTIKFMRANGYWWRNDQQDSVNSHGSWGQLCYYNVDVSDGHTPEGFKRIFREDLCRCPPDRKTICDHCQTTGMYTP